jgi:hypothetical protein
MSQNFSIDGQAVWNPSNGPGRLFTRLAEAVAEYRATSHPVTRALLEGFVATAAVLGRRGGCALPALDGPAGTSSRDIPGGGAAGPGRLAELMAESAVFSYFADHQQKLTRSFGRELWAAGDVRTPARDHRTRRALAEAVAVVEAGRTPAVRARLARVLDREPALSEAWLRDLVRRLLLRASPA